MCLGRLLRQTLHLFIVLSPFILLLCCHIGCQRIHFLPLFSGGALISLILSRQSGINHLLIMRGILRISSRGERFLCGYDLRLLLCNLRLLGVSYRRLSGVDHALITGSCLYITCSSNGFLSCVRICLDSGSLSGIRCFRRDVVMFSQIGIRSGAVVCAF